jgi:hypothetical protein
MTVIAMSRTEIDWMSVLQDLAASRIKIAEAATLMGLGRRQVFRLAKAYAQRGLEALVSRKRGRPSNRSHPADLRDRASARMTTAVGFKHSVGSPAAMPSSAATKGNATK